MSSKYQECDNSTMAAICVVAIILAAVFGIMWGECDGKSCSEHGCLNIGNATSDYKSGVTRGCVQACDGEYDEGADRDACISKNCNDSGVTDQYEKNDCITTCLASIDTKLTTNQKQKYRKMCVDGCSNSEVYRKCVAASARGEYKPYTTC
jgi:hypothetical protein